jgi:hypothetical protein
MCLCNPNEVVSLVTTIGSFALTSWSPRMVLAVSVGLAVWDWTVCSRQPNRPGAVRFVLEWIERGPRRPSSSSLVSSPPNPSPGEPPLYPTQNSTAGPWRPPVPATSPPPPRISVPRRCRLPEFLLLASAASTDALGSPLSGRYHSE